MMSGKLNEDALRASVREIVAAEFPNELEAFDISAPQIIKTLKKTGRAPTAVTAPHEFGIPVSDLPVGDMLHFIQILVATYFSVKSFLRDVLPKPDITTATDTIKESLTAELQKNGLSLEISKDIADKYATDILRVAKDD